MRTQNIFTSALLILICGLTFAGCGDGTSSVSGQSNNGNSAPHFSGDRAKVLNGSEQPESASPQMVRVEIVDAGGAIASCSGVVIAPGKVLTAGHCTTIATQITVITEGAAFSVSQVRLAPGYVESPELKAVFNDAAVLSVPGLAAPALPIIASSVVASEAKLLVFGFGLDESGSSGTLKFGETIASLVTPNHIFGAAYDGGNVDPCFGDSGGPLIATTTAADGSVATGVVGLVSSGTESESNGDGSSCNKGDVTLYTNLQNPALLQFLKIAAPGILVL